MNAKKGHSQSADNSQLLAQKSSPQGGHAFKLKAPYEPTGDQPQAIAELVKGFKEGNQCQTLLCLLYTSMLAKVEIEMKFYSPLNVKISIEDRNGAVVALGSIAEEGTAVLEIASRCV